MTILGTLLVIILETLRIALEFWTPLPTPPPVPTPAPDDPLWYGNPLDPRA